MYGRLRFSRTRRPTVRAGRAARPSKVDSAGAEERAAAGNGARLALRSPRLPVHRKTCTGMGILERSQTEMEQWSQGVRLSSRSAETPGLPQSSQRIHAAGVRGSRGTDCPPEAPKLGARPSWPGGGDLRGHEVQPASGAHRILSRLMATK